MASILNVDQINNAAGTSAVTIDSSGKVLMPGHVVQVVREYNNHPSAISTTSTSFTGSGVTAALTPVKNNSLILVDLSVSMADAVSTYMDVAMYYKVGTGSYGVFDSGLQYQVGYQHGSYNRYSPMVFGGRITVTGTDTLTFQPYFRSPSGGTVRYVHSNSSSCLTLTEIAQ